MATSSSVIEPLVTPGELLNEQSILSTLARLQEMHIALRNLRESIPRTLDSILVDPSNPEDLHSHFAQVVTYAARDIKNFTQTWDDPLSKEALQKAQESRENNDGDIRTWLVSENAGWLDEKSGSINSKTVSEIEEGDASGQATAFESDAVLAALAEVKEAHPSLEATMEEEAKTINVYLPPPAQIHFIVKPEPLSTGSAPYTVDTLEKTKLHVAIVKAIHAVPFLNNLNLILEMLASYVDIKSRPCVRCSRLLDRDANLPIKRSKEIPKQSTAFLLHQWDAIHPACG